MSNISIKPFFDTIYSLSENEKTRLAIDLIFQTMTDLFLKNQFVLADAIITFVDVNRLNSTLLVGFLSITLVVKDKLLNRPKLYAKIYEKLSQERGIDATNILLVKYE